MYDALMKKLTLGRRYDITGPTLKTKRNKFGNRYEFPVTAVSIVGPKTVRVHGQDKNQIWCRVDYELKAMPKWLKNSLKSFL